MCISCGVYLAVYCKQGRIGQNQVAMLEESQVSKNENKFQFEQTKEIFHEDVMSCEIGITANSSGHELDSKHKGQYLNNALPNKENTTDIILSVEPQIASFRNESCNTPTISTNHLLNSVLSPVLQNVPLRLKTVTSHYHKIYAVESLNSNQILISADKSVDSLNSKEISRQFFVDHDKHKSPMIMEESTSNGWTEEGNCLETITNKTAKKNKVISLEIFPPMLIKQGQFICTNSPKKHVSTLSPIFEEHNIEDSIQEPRSISIISEKQNKPLTNRGNYMDVVFMCLGGLRFLVTKLIYRFSQVKHIVTNGINNNKVQGLTV